MELIAFQNLTTVSDLDPTGTCELFNTTSSACADRIPAGSMLFLQAMMRNANVY